MGTLTYKNLRQFTGDVIRYRHAFNHQVVYTPGIKYVAEEGGAYWLIDAIATHLNSPDFKKAGARDYRVRSMHFWNLTVRPDNIAILQARADSPDPPFIEQAIPFSDFPMSEIDIWAAFDGQHWTLYLPSEH
jgi:hypothetical protein